MRGRPAKKEEKSNIPESEELQPCTDEWCESYHDGSARNCLKEVGDFIVCPDRTRPGPTSNEVRKPEPAKKRLKKLQIVLDERDQKIIDWIDRQAHEHRQDRAGYILNALENMMLRDMEAV